MISLYRVGNVSSHIESQRHGRSSRGYAPDAQAVRSPIQAHPLPSNAARVSAIAPGKPGSLLKRNDSIRMVQVLCVP